MPGGDRTGPLGAGPMTGRAAGYCAGYPVPGYMNPVPGRGYGLGMGWGRGRGWRNWYYATGLPGWARTGRAGFWGAAPLPYTGSTFYPNVTPKQELEALKAQAEQFQGVLKNLNEQIAELESEAEGKKD